MSVPFPFPILETERLILREWEESDADALFRLFSHEEVVRYTPISVHTDPARSLATVKRFRARFHEMQEGMVWAITRKDTGEVIGETGINEWVKEHFRVAIGYSLIPDHWGNGFATEAVGRIVRYAFNELPLFEVNRIEAQTDPANQSSIHVLKKLGFTKDAYIRQGEFEKGRFVDLVLFSMLRGDFSNP